ncbi:carbohydrate-binding module family 52 protein [Cordyceps fumosorosea ARSEF 2679]|uniref:Carbohydrate-binding module family 52 protein n=1 Tax=Cordyceps fumosorosea (strain ARSEF 2679) TaxID=1081104 RepID=A0A167V240_CORFA|nr:carbohydrate-binding module family 52 protein [Cordyceps fumosorosea ARSEF 2679]OAA62144.1 carbohydrate-binding module family 52 protein [Cordyceps fumosorosea ARSEF 2679]
MHLRGLTFYAPLAAALYTPSSGVLAGAGAEFAAGALLQPIKPCGDEWYNPNEYICHDGSLCPVINGEPLSRCGRACFSRYMYTCTNGTDLQLLPTLTRGRFSLRAANPQDSSIRPPAAPLPPPYGSTKPPPPIDGQPMTACRLTWNVGGITCSYCPTPPANPAVCPAGNTTALLAGDNAMDVVVPGGQAFSLTAGWTVGYTQAHSATQPPDTSLPPRGHRLLPPRAAGAQTVTVRIDPCAPVNGEVLAHCGPVCYSLYRFTCGDGRHLTELPAPTGAFRLRAEGDGLSPRSQPVTACHLRWDVGGRTCSRCPQTAGGARTAPLPCPAGDVAVVALSGEDGEAGMAAEVPGGQAVYLTRNFTVGYRPARTR